MVNKAEGAPVCWIAHRIPVFVRKEKQLTKKTKSIKQLQQSRKKTTNARKKTIRLNQLRWLRGAASEQLPLTLNTASALKRLYLSASGKLSVERKFNLLLTQYRKQQARRFSRAASRLTIRAKWDASVKSSPQDKRAFLKTNYNPAVFAQKRRKISAVNKFRPAPTPTKSALLTKGIAGRRRQLRRRGSQLSLLIHTLLLRRTARKLSFRIAAAKRFIRDSGQRHHQANTLSSSNKSYILAATRQEFKQLSSVARATASADKAAAVRKQPSVGVGRSYQQVFSRAAILAKKLKVLKFGVKQLRMSAPAVRRAKVVNLYSQVKEFLRSRFFGREVLAKLLTRNNPLLASRGTGVNLYARSTKKQALPSTALPLSSKLGALALRFRLQRVVRNTQKIPTFSKQATKSLPFLKRLPRRSKRALAVTRRASKKLGKGAQKHFRLATLRPKLSKQALVIPSKKPTAGHAIGWRRPAARPLRGKFIAGAGLLSVFPRAITPRKKTAICSTKGRIRRPLRTAMWSLLRAIKCYAARTAIASPHEYAVVSTMARKLRRGLRRGAYNEDEVLPNFLFLLKILVPAPEEQKKLYLSLQRWRDARPSPVALGRELRPQSGGTTFRTRVAAIRGRCQLRAGLSFNTPRLLTLPLPAPTITTTPADGRKLLSDQVVPYTTSPVAAPDTTNESTKGLYTPRHGDALAPAGTHQKKRLLPQIAKRRARFSRFIPQRVKSRLLRNSAVAYNKIAPASLPFPVERYSRQFYIKGNKVFATRYKKGLRVTAKRLVSQPRWSRATLLRLSRRRPVWRRLSQIRHRRSSTGRAIAVEPLTGSGRGWRARKNRIKQRSAFRVRAGQFKALVRRTSTLCLPGVLSAQSNLPTRVIKLTIAADRLEMPLSPTDTPTVLAVPALHTVQQQLTAHRAVRAVRANSVFTCSVLRASGGAYKRHKGRFILTGSKKRKYSRRPRWVRLLSKALTPTLNFASLSPQLIPAGNSATAFTAKTSTLQLRDRLWAGVSRYRRVPRLKMKTLGRIPAVNFEQTKLVKKLRRLSLFKKLLQGNKFGKLASLGALNALGEYKHLANLSSLADLGPVSGELKQQLLLQLATDIKLCAALCATNPAVQPQFAVTTRVSTRAFLARKPRVSAPGRDQTFFQIETSKKKVTRALKVRKLTLLRGLVQVKTKRIPSVHATGDGFNPLFVRTAKTKRAAAALRLRQYRRTLVSKVGGVGCFDSSLSTLKGLQWNSARSTERSAAQQGSKTRTVHKGRVKITKNTAPRFIPLRKLPLGYKKILNTVVVPQIWIGLLGRWTQRTATTRLRTKNQTLLKAFSTARPWGVKTLYSGHIGKNYSRFLAGVPTELADLKGVTRVAARKVKTGLPTQLSPARLAAARAVFAHRLPKILQFTPATTSNKFWQLRPIARDHVRTKAEQLFRAAALVHSRKAGRVTKTVQPRAVARRTNAKQVRISLPKEVVTTPALKLDYVRYHIKGLNITVFDQSVRNNLQQLNSLHSEERVGTKGYDFARRAYKAALSSQERNPKLPQPQFEEQKATVAALTTKLTGITPGGNVLELKQQPKNKATAQTAALPAPYTASRIDTNIPGNLTVAELESIHDETTRKDLKIFTETSTAARQSTGAYLLVKKAVLRSWTKVEGGVLPKESPFYNDLLLAAKAYSFYGVTLDLSSRAATNTKLAPTFAKLPK